MESTKIKIEMDKNINGFCGLLTIIFVIAKIFGYVNWSWWIVFLPVIVPIGVALIFTLVLVIYGSYINKRSN